MQADSNESPEETETKSDGNGGDNGDKNGFNQRKISPVEIIDNSKPKDCLGLSNFECLHKKTVTPRQGHRLPGHAEGDPPPALAVIRMKS